MWHQGGKQGQGRTASPSLLVSGTNGKRETATQPPVDELLESVLVTQVACQACQHVKESEDGDGSESDIRTSSGKKPS